MSGPQKITGVVTFALCFVHVAAADVSYVYALNKCYTTPTKLMSMKYTCKEGIFTQHGFVGPDCVMPVPGSSMTSGPSPFTFGLATWTCASGIDTCGKAWKAPGQTTCVISLVPSILDGVAPKAQAKDWTATPDDFEDKSGHNEMMKDRFSGHSQFPSLRGPGARWSSMPVKDKFGAPMMQPHGGAGKAVALGCTTLLEANNDGKMEWFESQGWYKKALQMCKSLSEKSPMELEQGIEHQKGQVLSQFPAVEGKASTELMKAMCSKLNDLPAHHEAKHGRHKWFATAERLCAAVQNASPEELQSMVQRSQMQAESASGQLMKQTCEKLDKAKAHGTLEKFQREPWYNKAFAMCEKLGTHKVAASGLSKRCKWFDKVNKSSKRSFYETRAWFKHLRSACKWVDHSGEGTRVQWVDRNGVDHDSIIV